MIGVLIWTFFGVCVASFFTDVYRENESNDLGWQARLARIRANKTRRVNR